MSQKPVLIDLAYWPEKEFFDFEVMLREYAPSYGRFEFQAQKSNFYVIRHIQTEGTAIKNGVNYRFFKLNTSRFWLPFKSNRYVKSLKPDAIVIQGFYNPLQTLLLSFQTKAPIIIQDHGGGAPRRLTGFFQRILARRVSNYAFTNKVQAEEYFEKGLISRKSKIYEIHEASSTMKRIDKGNARKMLQLPEDHAVFLWVGRLGVYKDPVTVLNGLKKVLTSNEKISFLMIFQENTLLEEVRETIASFGEAGTRVKLIGKIEHDALHKYYSAADYFVLGSHYEVSGFSLYEAMSCGCVPLVTDIPSFRRMTDNGNIGALWKVGDAKSLEHCLDVLLTKKYTLEREKTLSFYDKELSFEALGRKHMEMVTDILKNSGD